MRDTPVVCLLGPRQCGKSTLARRFDPKRAYYTFDDPTLFDFATADPVGFLASLPETVTLDEIQRVPALLPVIKVAVDRDRRPGRFLLTGSANLLLLPTASESLAGRMAVVRLQPLTEAEKNGAAGRFLAHLRAKSFQKRLRTDPPKPHDLTRRLLEGGYPEACRRPAARARRRHLDYVDAVMQRDVCDIAQLRRFDHLERLLRLAAHQTAQLLNINAVSKHLAIRRETVENHLSTLERLFLVRRLPAWHPNEARRLIKALKLHFVDSGSAADWAGERQRFGRLLESFVLQQLTAQAGRIAPELQFWHYRDKDGDEVDVVITQGKQTWGVEIKAAASVTVRDGQGLRRLAEHCGKQFQGGVLLYSGTSILPLGDPRLFALPLAQLWEL